MFKPMWDTCFVVFDQLLIMGKVMFRIFTEPIGRTVLIGTEEGTVLHSLVSFLVSVFGDMSPLDLIVGAGFPLLISFILIKFVVGLVL